MGLGLFIGWLDLSFCNQGAQVISEIFLRLLKLVSLPIIFLAITSTLTGMTGFREMRTLGKKVMTYTLMTTLVAATIALLLYLLIDPTHVVQGMEARAATSEGENSYFSFLLNLVPSNLFTAFAESNVMGIVFIAFLLSMAILTLPKNQKEVLHGFFAALFSALIKVTGFIVRGMPIAIGAFMVLLFKDLRENYGQVNQLLLYLLCVAGANVVQGLVILPLFLKWKGLSPWKAARGMAPALAVAFFSKSSNATLPVTMRCAETRLGVKQRVSAFTLPLCSIINMNGCAAFILTTVLFVSSLHGVLFSPFDLVAWIFLATCAAIGNAGVPMGCFFLTSAFLIGMHVPLYMMGLILPFYTLLDMLETTLNVWSDACVTLAIDREWAPEAASTEATPEPLLS